MIVTMQNISNKSSVATECSTCCLSNEKVIILTREMSLYHNKKQILSELSVRHRGNDLISRAESPVNVTVS
jgi:hypothetical protein